MANQQVGGGASKMRIPSADRARLLLQNVENLFNQALVDRAFEDASIPVAKLIGGATPAAHAATHAFGGSDQLVIESMYTFTGFGNAGYVLQSDGDGTLSFVAGGATQYVNTNLVSTNYGGVYGANYFNIAIGNNASALWTNGIAIGRNATAQVSSQYSIAFGFSVSTSGVGSIGFGRSATVATSSSIAIGTNSSVAGAGTGSVAMGPFAYVNGGTAVAIGSEARSEANRAISIGDQANALAVESIAIGRLSYASVAGTNGIAIGSGTGAGQGAAVTAANAIAIGFNALSSGAQAIAFGANVENATVDSIKMGWNNTAGSYIQFADFSPNAGVKTGTHSIPVTMNGATYHILLSNV